MANKEREARAAELLRKRFARVGVTAEEAIPAFTGMYPLFGGLGNWELVFTRWRLVARAGEDLQIWTSLTGPTPGKLLTTIGRGNVRIHPSRRRYLRVHVGGTAMWVHRRHRPTLDAWSRPQQHSADEPG